ncbi:hypothetical protein S83_043267, partial [Arachis hypogaea]
MANPKSHYSMAIQPQQPPSSVTGKHRILMTAPNFLRLLSILFSAVSVAVMVTSNQTVSLFSLSLEAHFYYSSAFKYQPLLLADQVKSLNEYDEEGEGSPRVRGRGCGGRGRGRGRGKGNYDGCMEYSNGWDGGRGRGRGVRGRGRGFGGKSVGYYNYNEYDAQPAVR